MANKLAFSAVGLLSLLAVGTFAQTATTDPVGFIKVTVPGAPSGGETYAFPSLSLVRAQEYRGVVASNTATVIMDSSATWTDGQFNGTGLFPITHYVEILTGVNAGATFDISATSASAKTITVAATFGVNALNGQSYRIRKHWTLESVFGAHNEAGLAGGSSTSADIVNVWDGSKYVSYYYRTNSPAGWRSTSSVSADQSKAVIYPEDGLFIKKHGTSTVELVVVGDVRTGAAKMAVTSGFNLLNPSNPVPSSLLTLGTSGLFTGDSATGLKAGSSTDADQVQVWSGTKFDSYYVRVSGGAVVGWRSTASVSTDASGVLIPAGASVIVRRQAGLPAFVWNRPQPF